MHRLKRRTDSGAFAFHSQPPERWSQTPYRNLRLCRKALPRWSVPSAHGHDRLTWSPPHIPRIPGSVYWTGMQNSRRCGGAPGKVRLTPFRSSSPRCCEERPVSPWTHSRVYHLSGDPADWRLHAYVAQKGEDIWRWSPGLRAQAASESCADLFPLRASESPSYAAACVASPVCECPHDALLVCRRTKRFFQT